MKLNDNERKILEVLADSYDTSGWDETGFYSFDPLSRKTGIERRKVRLACRSLRRKGLAKFEKALTDMDGMFAGAGYGATREGAALITPCDHCDDLATYDWWEKEGEIVCSLTEDAIHRRKCDNHYQESTNEVA